MTQSSLTPIDPATLPRDDPRLDQRWPTTLDGVSTDVETVSPRVAGMEWVGVTGLYDVLVRQEDLRAAVEVVRPAFPERFPGEKLPDDSLWPGEAFGKDPRVLCRLSWAQSWDLTAALGRAGIRAIVLPDDVPKEPAGGESRGRALGDQAHELVTELEDWTGIGTGTPPSTPVGDRWCVVVVLQADLDRAAELASKSLGSSFELDSSAYDG